MAGLCDIYLAVPRGFCAGVKRAISLVEKALKDYGAPVYVRHEIDCHGPAGGDCIGCGASGIGKDNRGIVANSVLISAICSADTRFLFYLCLRKAKIGCTSA